MDHPVDERHRQRVVVALVDGDIPPWRVLDDVLVEETVQRAAFGEGQRGEIVGGVGVGGGEMICMLSSCRLE